MQYYNYERCSLKLKKLNLEAYGFWLEKAFIVDQDLGGEFGFCQLQIQPYAVMLLHCG